MSSFPQHKDNIEELYKMGFDVDDCFDDGEVSINSWNYDELTYLLAVIIEELKSVNFKVESK